MLRACGICALCVAFGCGEDRSPDPADGSRCPADAIETVEGDCVGSEQSYPCEAGELALADGTCLAAGVQDNGCPAGMIDDGAGCRAPGLPPEQCRVGDDGGCVPILPDESCSPGTVARPGTTVCAPLMECGSDTWNGIPIEPNTVFVDESFTGISDGSAAAPWKALGTAVAAAEPGAIVALAAGTYTITHLIVEKPVRIWGRCPDLVTIEGTRDDQAALRLKGDGSELRGVAVTGKSYGVAFVYAHDALIDKVWIHDTADVALNGWDGASITARDVLVESAAVAGVFLYAAEATVERSTIRNIAPRSVDGWFGNGVIAYRADQDGARASVTLADVHVEDVAWSGVAVVGSDAVVERALIRDVVPAEIGGRGMGIETIMNDMTAEASTLEVRSSVVERVRQHGIQMWGADGAIEGTVVRDVTHSEGASGGIFIAPDDMLQDMGGTAELRASLVSRSHGAGVWVHRGSATVEGMWVRDGAAGVHPFSRGLVAARGADVVVRASRFESSLEAGVLVIDSAATLEANVIDNSLQTADNVFGDGVIVMQTEPESFPVSIAGSVISSSARGGVTNFGATVALLGSDLRCNPITLTAEPLVAPPHFQNRGGNRCGCNGVIVPCKVISSQLLPPAVPEPVWQEF